MINLSTSHVFLVDVTTCSADCIIREIVLMDVTALLKVFVDKVLSRRGLSKPANAAGCKVFTFGSYRLDVQMAGSDIDILCVVPKYVSRDACFELFEVMIRKLEFVTTVSVGLPLVTQ